MAPLPYSALRFPSLDRILTGAAILALAALTLSLRFKDDNRPQRPDNFELNDAVLGVAGDPIAPLAMIVVSDFVCAYCGVFARDTWPAIQHSYVDSGRLFVAFVGFPSTDNTLAARLYQAAECARRQDKFWPVHDSLFGKKFDLGVETILRPRAVPTLDDDQYRSCMKANLAPVFDRRTLQLESLGVYATPTFFLGYGVNQGRIRIAKSLTGALPFAAFDETLRSLAAPTPSWYRWACVAGVLCVVAGAFWSRRRRQNQDASDWLSRRSARVASRT